MLSAGRKHTPSHTAALMKALNVTFASGEKIRADHAAGSISLAFLIFKYQPEALRWLQAEESFVSIVSSPHCPRSHLRQEFEKENLLPQEVFSL